MTAKRRRRLPGRKRKAALRYTTGKSVGRIVTPRDNDLGSELLQMQRRALATDEHGNIGDVTMTTGALGALFTTSWIDRVQMDAGDRYAKLYQQVVGRVSPPAIVLDDDRGGRAPDDDAEQEQRRRQAERLWRDAAEALKAAGSRAKTQVDNAAIYNRRPHFMIGDVLRTSDARDALALAAGLDALAGVFGMRRSKAA